jgi:hypothetical protein
MFITPQVLLTIIATTFYVSFIWCCVTDTFLKIPSYAVPLVIVYLILFIIGNMILGFYTLHHFIFWAATNWG